MGVTRWSHDPTFHISVTVEARNFKFDMWTPWGTNDIYEKLGSRVWLSGHVTYFWNFETPSITRERLKLETGNLARRWTHELLYEGHRGREGVT